MLQPSKELSKNLTLPNFSYGKYYNTTLVSLSIALKQRQLFANH